MTGSTDRVTMARGLALLFGAGPTLVAITLLLPHRPGEAQTELLIPVLTAYVVTGLLLLAPHRFPPRLLSAVLAIGTAHVGLCVIFGGPAGAAYAFMYVWVALYAAAFFSAGETAAHVVWAFASYIAILLISGDVRPPGAHWLMAAGTSAVASALILGLTRELRGRAQDLAAVTGLAGELGGSSEVSGEWAAARVCEGVRASTGAASVILLEVNSDRSGLHVLGMSGSQELAAPFEHPEGVGALDEAYRSRAATHLLDGSAIVGLVQPIRRERGVAGLLAVVWGRPRRRISSRIADAVALFASEAGVALERIAHQVRDRERRAIELNDEIVQGLVVAKYALHNGRVEIGERVVDETLDRARALVESQLEELHGGAAPEPGSLRAEGRGIG